MSKNIKTIFLIIFNLLIFTACTVNKTGKNQTQSNIIEIGKIGSDTTIDRATVSKMLSLANYTKSEILNLERIINFNDTSENKWYDKYINASYVKGDMSGVLENEFKPLEKLTLLQTQYLIDKYDTTNTVKIKIDDENKDKPISYELWCDIYIKMMLNENIKEESVTILATKNTTSELKDYYAITDKGLYCFEGLDFEKYINTKIKILTNGIDVIAITEVLETEPTLNRCYVENVKNNEVTVRIGGIKKILKINDAEISQVHIGKIADIKFSKNDIVEINYYETELRGEIKRVTQNIINIENTNYILDEDFKLYSVLEKSVKYSQLSDIYVGQNICKFYVDGNKIYAGIIETSPIFDKIRILINDSNFKEAFDEIQIYSDGGFNLHIGNEIKQYLPNEIITINSSFNIEDGQIITLQLLDSSKGFQIKNLIRGYSEPTYFGDLEIIKDSEKYILINSIDFEIYIQGVLASNNGNYENIEMLKVMAILNRSIALANIIENKFSEFGANIDDSSKSILYNNLPITQIIKTAVQETEGQVLTYDTQVIKPNYFAYSAGVTANSGEIWADANILEFPSENKEYLLHKKLYSDTIHEDLNEEINSNIFFKSKDIECVENNSIWFRWTANLETSINNLDKNVEEIYNKYPNFIKTYENGEYIYKPISTIGKIKDITVLERGEAGNVMKIEITGEEEKILLMTDTVIRYFFDLDYIINNNGERVDGINKLVSSYFVFDKIFDTDGYLQKLVFYGGGNGHGVGLSLCAANEFAKNGQTFDEILNYFYSNIQISNM